MLKFFRLPFGTTGDRTAVPDAVDVNGNVSYSQGYGLDYQRQKTDPAAKNIERDKANQIYFDITNALAELQSQGVPDFITAALNGGTAYSYAQYAIVKYSGDLFISLVAANTATPADLTKWALLATPGRVRDGVNVIAAAAGTADAITATLTPTQTAFAPGPTWWRATAANATINPTFKRDGLAAKTLVKGNNLPLIAGDIPGAGAWMFSQYDATLDKEILLNPASGVASGLFAQLAAANAFTKGNRGVPTAITPTTGTITLDLNASVNWTITPTGNYTLANPSSMPVGQCGIITNTQGGTPYTIAYGSQWKPADGLALPALTALAAAVDDLVYYVESAGRVLVGKAGGSV